MRSWVIFALGVTLFAPGAAAQSLILEPRSDWTIDRDADSCAIQRPFGDEGQQALLELRSFGNRAAPIQFTIVSKDFKRQSDDLKFAIEPFDTQATAGLSHEVRLEASYEGMAFTSQIGANDPRMTVAYRDFVKATPSITEKQRRMVLRPVDNADDYRTIVRLLKEDEYQKGAHIANQAYVISPTFLEAAHNLQNEVKGIRIEGAFDRDLYLRTGELRTAMEAIEGCLEELYSQWGIDAAAHRSLRQAAVPLNFNGVASPVSRTYSKEMQRKGLEGYLRIRLNISADGRPTDCHLQSPLNDEAFRREACNDFLEQAKFSPALGASGQPIPSIYQTSIMQILLRPQR